jgi:antitoxin ParD1/3/4
MATGRVFQPWLADIYAKQKNKAHWNDSTKNGKLCQEALWSQAMATMNISLTPQLEKLVQDRVNSGRYTSASEVMREALRLLEAHDQERDARLAQLRTDVDGGLKQLDAGKSSTFDEATAERIKRRGRAKLAQTKG